MIAKLLLGTATAVLWLSFARPAGAESFRYVDRDGREHMLTVDLTLAPSPVVTPPEVAASAPPVESGFPYFDITREAADMYSLPIELIRAVMQVESGFNARAVSWAGALGLMQLMPTTAGDLGVVDPFDPRQNIFGGARQLRILLNTFEGDLALTLAAYHAGAGAVRRSGGFPVNLVTRRYVVMVLSLYKKFQTKPTPFVLGTQP